MARSSSTLLALCAGGLAAVLVSPAFISIPAGAVSQVSSRVRTVGSREALPQNPTKGAATGVLAGGLLLAGAAVALRSSVARRAEPVPAIPRPENLLESDKFPKFGGSTGGYMSRATRERHAITWTAKEEAMFEMPTAGFAIMNKGENLCYFRKKEQCLSLGKQLRKMKIENYKIYRIKKDGTVLFMHPADGVFPEKVNKGRVQVNGRPFSIGQNAKPGTLQWTKYGMKVYEADALSTMFVKARVRAFLDEENLFAIPAIDGWVKREDPRSTWSRHNELAMSKGQFRFLHL